jgi:hypothetical protein
LKDHLKTTFMAYARTVESYAVAHYPSPSNPKGRINLYCEEDHRLYLLFYDDSEDLPANTFSERYNTGRAYLSYTAYSNYIDLIRNEKPVRVTFVPEDSPPTYVVWVSEEEPGEGEI